VLLGALVAFALVDLFWREQYIRFLERTLSPDGKVSLVYLARQSGYLGLAASLVVSLILFHVPHQQVWQGLGIRAILRLGTKMRLAYTLALLLVFLWIFLRGNQRLYAEDGVLEQLTAALFLASSVAVGARLLRPRGLSRWHLLLLAAVFFALGMEEISWGQRLMGWETPELWKRLNYQDETDLHNLIKPAIRFLYVLGNLLLGYCLLARDTRKGFLSALSQKGRLALFVAPAGFSFFGYFFLFLSLESAVFHGELTEEVWSLIGFVYASSLPSGARGAPQAEDAAGRIAA